jgi:hypothetical protein
MRERRLVDPFLPRSASVFVFILVVACYDWAVTALLAAIVRVLPFPPRPPSFWESHGDPTAHVIEALVFAPLVESCLLIGAVELLRWLRVPTAFQVFLAAVVIAAPHSYTWGWEPYAFIVTPSFAIQAASYLYWRAVSRKRGFAVVASIHALHNLVPAMSIIAYATRMA